MKKIIVILLNLILLVGLFSTNTEAITKRKHPRKAATVAKIGGATAAGAGVGALIGGKRGAASGALIGGGAMTAHSVARRNSGYGSRTRTVGTVAAGSAVGTGVGAAIGGKKGAGIGALAGGGGSAIYATRKK